jgi:hypothetical protein
LSAAAFLLTGLFAYGLEGRILASPEYAHKGSANQNEAKIKGRTVYLPAREYFLVRYEIYIFCALLLIAVLAEMRLRKNAT